MLCQVPVDYHLKQSKISYEIKSALTLADEIIIEGVSKLNNRFDMTASVTVISKPARWLNLEICDLLIHWQPNTTYKFRFSQDFYRDSDNQPNPQFDITYTTNPLPAIVSANPAFNATNVTNNTKIVLNFDRKMRYGEQGTKNIYLYEVASPSDILVDTYTNDDVTLSPDGASVTISTLGAIKANTQYYLLIEGGIYRDYDNFSLPAVTDPAFYTFRTDESEDDFPDLITIQFVTGDLYSNTQFARLRTPSSTFEIIDVNLFVYDQYRYRRFRGNFTVETDITSKLTYNKGSLRSNISSMFESVDNVLTYNKGGLKSDIDSNFDYSVEGKRFTRGFRSNQSVNFDLINNQYIRFRRYNSNQTSEFTQTSTVDYGLLDSTRSSDTYTTDIYSTIISGGPLLSDNRGPADDSYNLIISPSTTSAISNLIVPAFAPNLGQSAPPALPYEDRNRPNITTRSRSIVSGNGQIVFTRNASITTDNIAVWKKINNVWIMQQELLMPSMTVSGAEVNATFNACCATNYDGSVLAVLATNTYKDIDTTNGNTNMLSTYGYGTLFIFTLQSGSYVKLQELNIGAGYTIGLTNWSYGGYTQPNSVGVTCLDMSDSGDTIVLGGNIVKESDKTSGGVIVYQKSGSTWTKQTSLLPDELTYPKYVYFGENLTVSSDGNTVFIVNPNINYAPLNSVQVRDWYVFKRSGSTWTKNFKTNYTFIWKGRSSFRNAYALMTKDALTIFINGNTLLRPWTFNGSTWIQGTDFSLGQRLPKDPTGVMPIALLNSLQTSTYNRNPNCISMSSNFDGSKIIIAPEDTSDDTIVSQSTTYNYYYEGYLIFNKSGSTWIREENVVDINLFGTIPSRLDKFEGIIASKDLGICLTTNGIKTLVNKSFNSVGKTLTISNLDNEDIIYLEDYVVMIPATGYNQNFQLTYTATRLSDGFQSIRFQNINNV